MDLSNELLPASYRGVSFLVDNSVVSGGRKTVINEYPSSNRRFVEDLGLLNKTFTLSGIITGENYTIRRNSLIQALEKGGTGVLIHPFFGVLNVVSTEYSLQETMTLLGEARFSLTFLIAQDPILPRPITSTLSNIFSAVAESIAIIQTAVLQAISITTADNYLDAISKTQAFLATVGILTTKVPLDSDQVDTLGKTIGDFSSNIGTIVNDSVLLAQNIVDLVNVLDDTVSTPTDSANLFQELYDFGNEDQILEIDTFELNERRATTDRLNGSIQTLALLMNYRNVPQKSFLTVEDVDRERNQLNVQFEEILTFESISKMDKSALQSARSLVRKFLDEAEQQAFKIESFTINETTITELTYRLYGNLDNLQNLIGLNNFTDISHIKGEIKILNR